MTKEELINWIKKDYLKNIDKELGQVIITSGAGDIDTVVEPIKKIIEKI